MEAIPAWTPGDSDRERALVFWQRQKFAYRAAGFSASDKSADPDYQDSLAAYATWRNMDQPAAVRCAALAFALQSLRAVCGRAFTAERASTWARVAWEWGARGESVMTLQRIIQMLKSTRFELMEPYWPACPRFDIIPQQGRQLDWFATAVAEQFERTWSFSSAFSGGSPVLAWLCNQKLASTEMERRRTLIAARGGLRPRVPERLRIPAPDHRNADIWRAGSVPGTVLGT